MGIVVLTMKASVIEMFLVLLVTGIHSNKEMTKKIKRPKFTVPQINCDVKAGKIINPEFIVKCPAGCQDPKYHVYGTGIYASYSSVCGAAVHSGVLDNSGGKILVQKVAGQSGYKGSFSNGVQSLSLPRWRESFIVSESKPQKGVTYPSTLTYSSSKSPDAKAGETTKAYQRPSAPGTTAQPVTLMQILAMPAAEVTHATLPKPFPFATSATSSPRPQPVGHGSWEMGTPKQDSPGAAFQEPMGADVGLGFIPKEELSTQSSEPVSQGDPNCKVDLSFLIDGSSGIGKRRFQIQKQFLADIAQALDIGPAGPLMGVVQYGDNPATQFNLKTHMNSRDLKTAIEKITQRGGLSNAVCRTNGFYSFNVQSWLGLSKTMQPLVKRVCDTDRLACSKTCLNSADIGFVIDGSSSVGTGNFRTVLQFVANISKEFEISDTDTRIGAVQYTYEQRLEFGFDKYSTKPDILNAIKRVGYWSGGTSTGAAIHYALEQLFKKSKPNKRKLMILITDGRSYDDVRIPAMAAHQKGVITYAIGVAWAAQDELEVIATHPARDHSFFVDEFDNLYKSNPRIIQNICTEFNAQPRN
uniref:vitrin n=1 Tax=Urocitellus parryii TaxID=9999 RepID=UPI000E560E39|nr:vitrin [Urocitellus parryii]